MIDANRSEKRKLKIKQEISQETKDMVCDVVRNKIEQSYFDAEMNACENILKPWKGLNK